MINKFYLVYEGGYNFERIKVRYSENQWDTPIGGFFKTIEKMKDYPEFTVTRS